MEISCASDRQSTAAIVVLRQMPFFPFDAPPQRPQRRTQPKIVPDETAAVDPSVLRELGESALSGISAVFNVIDTPGSVLRDAIALARTGDFQKYNPLDQLLSPFSSDNRITGRDLNRVLGLAGKDDTWLNFIGGIGTEILLDNPGWGLAKQALKGGGKALTSFGRSSAGRATERAASRLMKKPLVRKARDVADEAFRLAKATLYAPVMGTRSRVGQKAAKEMYAKNRAVEEEILKDVLPVASSLKRAERSMGGAEAALAKAEAGLDAASPAASVHPAEYQRAILEGVAERLPSPSPGGELPKHAERMVRSRDDALLKALQSQGYRIDELSDIIRHVPRYMGRDVAELYGKSGSTAGRGPFSGVGKEHLGREDIWKGFRQGTYGVNRLLSDPAWVDIIEKFRPLAGGKKKAVEEITQEIAARYGKEIVRAMPKRNERGNILFRDLVTGRLIQMPERAMKTRTVQRGDQLFLIRKKPFGRGPASEIPIEMLTEDRYRHLAKAIVNNPEMLSNGLFTNHWLMDFYMSQSSGWRRVNAAQAVYDILSTPGVIQRARPAIREAGEKFTTVGDIFKEMNIGREGLRILAERLGLLKNAASKKEVNAALKIVRRLAVKEDVASDISTLWSAFKVPDDISAWLKAYDSLTASFKAGVLSFPARHMRDLMSGMWRNFERGWLDKKSFTDAHMILQGNSVVGYESLPWLQAHLQQTGRVPTKENLTQALAEVYASLRGPMLNIQSEDILPFASGLSEMAAAVPGTEKALDLRRLLRVFSGREPGTNLNPLDIAGVYTLKGEPRLTTKFGPVAASNILGNYTDAMNRLVPWLSQIRRGVDPRTAMRRVMEAQVEYAPQTFSHFERKVLKRLMPFWSFTSRSMLYMLRELARNPRGRMALTKRITARATADDPSLPEHVSQTTAIPVESGTPLGFLLGAPPPGVKRYLTGMQLMHEDPASFFGGGVRGALTEALSRLHPLPKALIEWGTGESLFQRTPTGGRELESLDPTLGRTISNISEMIGLGPIEQPSGRAKPFISPAVEFVLANSPLSRLLSTARVLTDPRKTKRARAANLLTGLRVYDVEPKDRDTTLAEKATQLIRRTGGRVFERPYFPPETLERMTPEQRNQAQALIKLMDELAVAAKKRKLAKTKEKR